jgi:beta-xylosidase
MNLIYLLTNADMECLPSDDYERVLNDLNSRFQPELDDNDAAEHIKKLVKNCIAHSGAEIIEKFHNLAKWKNS